MWCLLRSSNVRGSGNIVGTSHTAPGACLRLWVCLCLCLCSGNIVGTSHARSCESVASGDGPDGDMVANNKPAGPQVMQL